MKQDPIQLKYMCQAQQGLYQAEREGTKYCPLLSTKICPEMGQSFQWDGIRFYECRIKNEEKDTK